MDQHSKSELVKTYRKQYKRVTKGEKTRIIDTIIESTGYCRDYVIRALNQEADVPKKITRERVSRYEPVTKPLERLWAISNLLCGKRLQPLYSDAS